MMRIMKVATVTLIVASVVLAPLLARSSAAATAGELARDAKGALSRLSATQPSAKLLAANAKAILVFPRMVKAGFMFGGQIGEGALLKKNKAVAFYSSVAASYGLQAGIQSFGYVLFFMNDKALQQLDDTRGFEIGVGPSIVIVDEGVGRSMTSTTLTSDVYAFIFDQKGLMAGLGIQGSKITKIAK